LKVLKTAIALLSSIALALPSTLVVAPAAQASNCTASASFVGNGELESPFEISSPQDLMLLSNQVGSDDNPSSGKHYRLTQDIDMDDCAMPPIGNTSGGKEFRGTFDGAGKTIAGYRFSNGSMNEVALFGATTGAIIKDLWLNNFTIFGNSQVGALVGVGLDTALSGIKVTGSNVTGVGSSIGVVAGELKDTNEFSAPDFAVTQVVATESFVTGPNRVGGLFGSLTGIKQATKLLARDVLITQSGTVTGATFGGLIGLYSLGSGVGALSESSFRGTLELTSVEDQSEQVGGLIGSSLSSGANFSIIDSYARGEFLGYRGSTTIGGLVGNNVGLQEIKRSYSAMKFQAKGSGVGLRVAPITATAPTLTGSVVDITVHNLWQEATPVPAGVGKTTAELTNPATLTGVSWTIEVSGDIIRDKTAETTWAMHPDIEAGYPVHVWAYEAGYAMTPCKPGRFSVDGKGPCQEATPGRFVRFAGQMDAEPCPPGFFQPGFGATECLPAEPGHKVVDSEQTAQTQCEEGTYQGLFGQDRCLIPQPGFYATGLAQVIDLPCPIGTFKSFQSTEPCTSTPPGTYADETRQTEAKLCPAGTHQPLSRQALCIPAQPGFFVISSGQAESEPCAPGTYQPETGQETCIRAAAGNFVTGDVRREQVQCQVGSYQPLAGQSDCILASPGSFVLIQGAAEQEPCAPGTFQPFEGQRTCINAEPGFFVPFAGSIDQQRCPSGLTSAVGAASCSAAGAGGGGGGGFIAPPVLTPALGSNPIPAGSGFAIVSPGGTIRDVTPSFSADRRSLSLQVGSATLSFTAGSGLRFSETGSATAAAGTELLLASSGFEAGSTVVAYLIPAQGFVSAGLSAFSSTLIGETTVDSAGGFALTPKIAAAPGSYVLQLSGTLGGGEQITMAFALAIQTDQKLATWAKRMVGNTQAKLYAKDVIGEGKVSFRVNGKEIAWVRAVDETDPKLRLVTTGPMAGANYLVRTVNLKKGKNVLEIFVDGKRLTRTAYSRK